MQIKCLAQGHNILMQPAFELSIFVSRCWHLIHLTNMLRQHYMNSNAVRIMHYFPWNRIIFLTINVFLIFSDVCISFINNVYHIANTRLKFVILLFEELLVILFWQNPLLKHKMKQKYVILHWKKEDYSQLF